MCLPLTRAKYSPLIVAFVVVCTVASTYSQQKDPVLAAGDPVLTQSMVDSSTQLLEWSLGSQFSERDRSNIQRVIVNAWRANNRAQMKSVLDVIEIQNFLQRMNEAERNALKEQFRASLLQNMSREPRDELSVVVLDAYERSRSGSTSAPTSAAVTPTPGLPATAPRPRPIWRSEEGGLWAYSAATSPGSSEQAIERLRQISVVRPAAAPLPTFAEALSRARAFLVERASREALAAFNASPEAKKADRAALAAGRALVARKPLAALAALLRAHELEPRNATHLANLAAVLSLIGMPAEALGILDSDPVRTARIASPLGIGGRAGVLSTRGHSLIQLGQAREAETVLRQAVSMSPKSSEASSNLAFALWMQDDPKKKEEAGRLIAGVWRRMGARPERPAPGRETPPPRRDEETVPEKIPTEIFENGTVGLDLSRGKRLKLPDLKIPGSPEASVAMHPQYMKVGSELEALLQQLIQRGEEYQEKVEAKASSLRVPTAAELTAMRALASIDRVKSHPSVRPFWEKARKAWLNNNQGVDFRGLSYSTSEMYVSDEEVTAANSQLTQLMKRHAEVTAPMEAEIQTACANAVGQSCPARIREKYRLKTCPITRQAHAKWRSGIHDYDTALRNYLEAAYKHMTALLAHIRDRDQYEVFRTEIEEHIYEEWAIHVQMVDSIYDVSKEPCPTGALAGEEEIDKVQAERPDFCPPFLDGGRKIKVDFKFISLSAGCETLGVELSSPWLGLFLEGEANFKGGWISKYQGVTIGAGVKAGIGTEEGLPIGVEGKAGGYVKLDKDGKIMDAGFKAGATMTVGHEENPFGPGSENTGILGAGEVGVDYELTILPALGLPAPD